MGEIADATINGELCQRCGKYLGDAVGCPRYCSSCKPKKKMAKGKEKITTGEPAIKGVRNFIVKNGLHEDDLPIVVRKYGEFNLPSGNVELNKDITEWLCEHIQKDFSSFVKWFRNNYK